MVLSTIVAFLVLLNPFAMFIYLSPVMKDLSHADFVKVLGKAALMSCAIFIIFAIGGTFFFEDIFHISFEAFRIFGGIIIFSIAYLFIIRGQRALIHMQENLDDLASEIALPFMAGAATISFAILMAEEFGSALASGLIVTTMIIYVAAILALKLMRDSIRKKKLQIAFDKNMEILLRLNGFFLGAIGVDLTSRGIQGLFFGG